MLINKIGEFGLIEKFKRLIKTDSSVIVGSGDDCAVLEFDKNNYLLFTCDMLVKGVDFKACDDPYLVGRKSLAISISDIASCCGLPRYCLISLGMPKNTSIKYADRLFKGMLSIAQKFKINITGGDLSRSGEVTIDVSMLGIVEKKNLVLRSRAKIGDMICVTGELGGSILGKHLRFVPRLEEAAFLAKNFKINSMIDISDGLIQDLGHILRQSNRGAMIYENLLPISKCSSGLADALYSGEDFELLFTLNKNEAQRLLEKSDKFKIIGEVVSEKQGLRLIDKRGRQKFLSIKGFRHF
ncbi:MAG: thiamine-phosphate kinase [Candidatus Omnitrophota bacterium]|nr:thiamine-phosphate kinase [Candidatus Omnitrophota bacterium]